MEQTGFVALVFTKNRSRSQWRRAGAPGAAAVVDCQSAAAWWRFDHPKAGEWSSGVLWYFYKGQSSRAYQTG